MTPFSNESTATDTHTPIGETEELKNSPIVLDRMDRTERRFSRRLNLRWRLRLSSESLGVVETNTENISSRGFYCTLESPPVPGDIATCTISVPTYSPGRLTYFLVCQAEVIRVEAAGATLGFGVAWRIIDYTVERHEESFAADR